MPNNQHPTKEQLVKAIERLERNPDDIGAIFAEIGISVMSAVGSGGLAAALGVTTTSIPIITALTGITVITAAPVGLVVGAAVLGGFAGLVISEIVKNGGFEEGKQQYLLNEYREKQRDFQAKQRKLSLSENDKAVFYQSLKNPIKYNLISSEDAHNLMQAVENGQISLSEAYRLTKIQRSLAIK